MVSYDVLTIHVDSFSIDKSTMAIEAKGNVITEDGRSRVTAAHVFVEFKSDPLKITYLK